VLAVRAAALPTNSFNMYMRGGGNSCNIYMRKGGQVRAVWAATLPTKTVAT
jgi:hypothetical protein